jgi:hypothetical protein
VHAGAAVWRARARCFGCGRTERPEPCRPG